MVTDKQLTRHEIKECLFDMDLNDWYRKEGPYHDLKMKVYAQYGADVGSSMLRAIKDEIIDEMR